MKGAKGFVLAAGLGTRLKPLTALYPKPLIPFLGSSPLEIALGRHAEAGIMEVAINSHHLPEQVAALAERNPFGQKIFLSHEPVLLGTAGAYNPLRQWLGDDDLVVLNGDIVSDIDIAQLLAHHRAGKFAATMALLPKVVPGEKGVRFEGGRALGLAKDLPPPVARNFAGNQILTKRFLALFPETGVVDMIKQGYDVAFASGVPVGGVVHEGYWHDIRDAHFYWAAVKDMLARQGLASFVAPGAEVDRSATIGKNAVVERGAKIGQRATVSESLILPGAVVGDGQTVTRQLVLPGPHAAIDLCAD